MKTAIVLLLLSTSAAIAMDGETVASENVVIETSVPGPSEPDPPEWDNGETVFDD